MFFSSNVNKAVILKACYFWAFYWTVEQCRLHGCLVVFQALYTNRERSWLMQNLEKLSCWVAAIASVFVADDVYDHCARNLKTYGTRTILQIY